MRCRCGCHKPQGQVIVSDTPVKPERRPPNGEPLPPVVIKDLPH